MDEKTEQKKKITDYRQLTVRVEHAKFKALKRQLVEEERTIQDWLINLLDEELLKIQQKQAA